ncbi:AsmA family protein [Mariprofundus ferrinatatus]|uniref:AsmA family protein n=1 Tax=Mariprofundus ferrinatatus TaxID=1921087 RepID=A0A2K8L5C5_9PROT|nr:AsmA family protein [Mariprofundus ferrinatatus]ATX82443.1 AsmA family protein [Mariprofundus ferrinatatus]
MTTAVTKTVRYSLIILGLLIVALLVAPFFIDVNTYKTQIEQGVEDATGRKLTIGTISASLFPWIGVELEDVHLANRDGFAARDFASVQKLNVKLALLPLLSKNIEIKHFEITSPNVYLERHKDGQTNWGDLVASEASSGAAPADSAEMATADAPASPALAALQAESLTLTDGEFTWADAESDPVVLSALNVELNDVQLERPVGVKVSGKLSGNAFDVDATVGPLGDLAKLDPVQLPVQGQIKADKVELKAFKELIKEWPEQLGDINSASIGLNAKMEQRPDGLRLGEGEVVLNSLLNIKLGWKVDMAKPDTLEVRRAALAVNGKDLLEARGSVNRLTTEPAFQLRVDGQPLERSWLAAFAPELNSLYAGHPSPWKQIKFGTLLAGDAKQVEIRDMQLMLDQELVQISGAVVYAVPDIRLRIATRALHMDPWLPQPKEEQAASGGVAAGGPASPAAAGKVATKAAEKPAEEPDLRFLKPWRVTAKVQADTLYLRGLQMGNFNVNINGSGGQFDLNPLRFNLAGGSVTETASLNAAAFPASWKESVHITDVQVGPLLKALADMDMLEGKLSMDTNLKATGLTPAAMKTLNGGGNVLMGNGKIKGFDIAGAIRKFTNPMAAMGPKETDFSQLSGSFTVDNGIATNQDLFMASPLLRVTGNGTVDLVRKLLDYHIKPRVVGTLIGQGDSAAVRRGLTVPLHITGPFDAPSVKPEISASTIIENAPALLNKGKVGGALGKILGGGAPANQDAPADQPAPPPESPEKKLLKGLGGAFGF